MTADIDEIKQLDELVSHHIEKSQKLAGCKLTNLTAPGENYGSLMLKVDITLKDEKTKNESTLYMVAKMIPRLEVMQEIFNIQVTFKNEIGFYIELIPTIQQFLTENKIYEEMDFVAKSFGGRFNIESDKDKEIDEHAVLLLENLKIKGYVTCDRHQGFDLATTEIILKNLAKFNAYPLALKLKKPKTFEEKVKPHLSDYYVTNNFYEPTVKRFCKMVKEETWMAEDIKEKCISMIKRKQNKITHEPWASVSHNDLWVNNLMVKFENNQPENAILLDFQVCEYKSPIRDLAFLLFTSVSLEILKNHLDNFLDLYYTEFTSNLKKFGIDCSEDFSRKSFDEQLKLAVNESEFYHIIYMWPVLDFRGKLKDMSEIGDKVFNPEVEMSKEHKERFTYTMKEFVKRKWIY